MKNTKSAFYFVLVFLFLFAFQSNSQTITTGNPTQSYTVGGSAVILAPGVSVNSGSAISTATVSIQENVSGDILASTISVAGLSASWDSGTKTLTVSGPGSASDFEDLLQGITFSTANVGDGSRTIDFIIGSGAVLNFGGQDHYYEVVPSSNITWPSAKTAAQNRYYSSVQGYLATITSEDENDFIDTKVTANAWIGASDNNAYTGDAEGEWYWVTGPEDGTKFWTGGPSGTGGTGSAVGTLYNNWDTSTNEPNESGSGEDYGHMLGGSGKWNDLPEDGGGAVDYYIVEYNSASFGASDYVNVNVATNNPPVANNDSYNIYQNTTRTISAPGILGNDTDADVSDVLSVTSPTTLNLPDGGSGSLASNGGFNYTPFIGFYGLLSFQYTVSDGIDTDNGTVYLTVLVPQYTGNGDFDVSGNWNGGYVPPKIDTDMDIVVTGTMTTTAALTIRNLTVTGTGTLNIGHNMVIEDLTINTSGTINFSNGATLTVNGDIYNENRKGIENNSQIILKSQLKVH